MFLQAVGRPGVETAVAAAALDPAAADVVGAGAGGRHGAGADALAPVVAGGRGDGAVAPAAAIGYIRQPPFDTLELAICS